MPQSVPTVPEWPTAHQERRTVAAREYRWAIDIIARHFTQGLCHTFERARVRDRLHWFQVEQDPIYSRLIASSGRDVYETFIGFWKLGQTLSTQSRFWFEAAICDIVRAQTSRFGQQTTVYSLHDLPMSVWNVRREPRQLLEEGDRRREWDRTNRAFRVELKTGLLEYVEQEIGRLRRRSRPADENELYLADLDARMAIPDTITKGEPACTLLRCNLLVVQPEPGSIWAVRYLNERALTGAVACREKENVLLLFGWLCQEKILREPGRITSVAAVLLPRGQTYPGYRRRELFSGLTRWSHDDLWRFIGVPYEVVEIAMEEVGVALRPTLVRSLRTILPGKRKPAAVQANDARSGTHTRCPLGSAN